MKYKAVSTVIMWILCSALLTGCTLLPLREEVGSKRGGDVITEIPDAKETPKTLIKPTKIEEPDNLMYCISAVNIRDAASSNSNVIGELKKGEQVTVLSMDGSWIEVEYKGKSAFVYEKYLGDKQE